MRLTFRPQTPPAALTSSQYICAAGAWTFPAAANGPVKSVMTPKVMVFDVTPGPVLIGGFRASPVASATGTATANTASTATHPSNGLFMLFLLRPGAGKSTWWSDGDRDGRRAPCQTLERASAKRAYHASASGSL